MRHYIETTLHRWASVFDDGPSGHSRGRVARRTVCFGSVHLSARPLNGRQKTIGWWTRRPRQGSVYRSSRHDDRVHRFGFSSYFDVMSAVEHREEKRERERERKKSCDGADSASVVNARLSPHTLRRVVGATANMAAILIVEDLVEGRDESKNIESVDHTQHSYTVVECSIGLRSSPLPPSPLPPPH